MKQTSAHLLTLCILTTCVACSPAAENSTNTCFANFKNCIFISGKLSQDHVDLVAEQAPGADLVLITSGGGQARFGHQIGALIDEYDLPLLVAGNCSSSCAEYIMPGAAYVIFLENPKIGFHGNSMIRRDLAEAQGYTIEEHCWPSLAYMERIYAEKGLSYEFVEMQKAAIDLPEIEFIPQEDGCLYFRAYDPLTEEWLPSVEIMRDVWGLDIREYGLDR